jgi:hypothetical protein
MTQSNILFIGMDVHKESIVVSLADDDRSEIPLELFVMP